ncbi:DRTGG domain-containing protein [Desulfoluna butyratoxydans]|uniref:Drtgg n=1 Tax=Desulfoluna butyratoxydans TaxID=231438 RepID=A0A4U8YMV9_9BACT|nr:DRTGG domain-containing protein [Desulfoluna butyratoxydans]VFQ44509.1 drtgg [Desulfoluna butyratoxydans]
MKITNIATLLGGNIVTGKERVETRVSYGFAADLLSDVLTLEVEGVLLITGLCTLQTIRTAEMAEIECVVIARGKKVSPAMKDLAERTGLILIEVECSVFRASAMLFDAGLEPVF